MRGFSGGRRGQSELVVIVRAKELCGYVLTVTDKSPKKFRFTLVSRLQSYALDALECLYKANLVRVRQAPREGISPSCTACHLRSGW